MDNTKNKALSPSPPLPLAEEGLGERVSRFLSNPLFMLLNGASLPLAFAPFNLWPLAIITLAIFIFCLQRATPKQAIKQGFCFGLGYFSVGISWVYVSINVYGQSPPLVAGLLTALLVLYLSLYPVLFAYLAQKLPTKPFYTILGIPALWVFTEWLRSVIFTGFPWLLLGYSSTESWLAGFAPIVGVYGCSFIIILLSSLLINTFVKKSNYTFALIITVFIFGFALKYISWVTPSQTSPTTVSLIQPNTPQELKWDYNFLDTTLNTLQQLTQQALGSEIIIWPEAAVPMPLPDATPIIHYWESFVRDHQFTLITGILNRINQTDYHNSLISRSPSSESYYAKQHLVPYGEYIPFKKYLNTFLDILNLPMPNTHSGEPGQPYFYANHLILAPAICYEIAYPTIVEQQLPRADAIITVSNDTWFGNSIGPKQHLQMAQMRAIESARYVLRATNNGITAIIDNKGQITHKAPSFQQAVLKGEFQAYQGATPLMYYGTEGVLMIIGLILLGVVIFRITQLRCFGHKTERNA